MALWALHMALQLFFPYELLKNPLLIITLTVLDLHRVTLLILTPVVSL